jgi:hypothetical protein
MSWYPSSGTWKEIGANVRQQQHEVDSFVGTQTDADKGASGRGGLEARQMPMLTTPRGLASLPPQVYCDIYKCTGGVGEGGRAEKETKAAPAQVGRRGREGDRLAGVGHRTVVCIIVVVMVMTWASICAGTIRSKGHGSRFTKYSERLCCPQDSVSTAHRSLPIDDKQHHGLAPRDVLAKSRIRREDGGTVEARQK